MLLMYLCGWFLTTIGVLVACTKLPGRGARLLGVASLAVLAGILWPVLLIGVLQLVAIVAVVEPIRALSSRR